MFNEPIIYAWETCNKSTKVDEVHTIMRIEIQLIRKRIRFIDVSSNLLLSNPICKMLYTRSKMAGDE